MAEKGEHQIWNCPFCGEETIKIFCFESPIKPPRDIKPMLKYRGWKMLKQETIVLSGCSKCGKTIKEVARGLEGEFRGDVKEANKVWYIG